MKSPNDNPVLSFAAAFAWWVAAASLFSLFFWSTLPLERRATARLVDAAFVAAGDSRRVDRPAPLWGADGVAALAGTRFLLKKTNETAVVFAVNGAGVSSSFVAVYSPLGEVLSVLPLDPDSVSAAQRLPPGLLATHLARIEAAETAVRRKSEK